MVFIDGRLVREDKILRIQKGQEPRDYNFTFNWRGVNMPVKLSEYRERNSLRICGELYMNIPEKLKDNQSDIIQKVLDVLTVYGFGMHSLTKIQCGY